MVSSLSTVIGGTLLADAAPMVLGGVLLTGQEVPQGITLGGTQHLVVHRLAGGQRIIDAMGPDERSLTWTGMFIGPSAAARARLIDAMRRAGEPQPLSFADYALTVVISTFEYSYQDQGSIVPYRIRAELLDPAGSNIEEDADQSVVSDLTQCVSLLESVSSGSSVTGLAATAAALQTLGQDYATQVVGGTSSRFTTLQTNLGSSLSTIQAAAQSDFAGTLGQAGDDLAFEDAASLSSATSVAGEAAASVSAAGYLNRVGANLATSGGGARSIIIQS